MSVNQEAWEALKHEAEQEDIYGTDNGARDLAERVLSLAPQVEALIAERDQLRAALEAVAVSKFATEPHRIARDALESISPGKQEAR